MNSTLTLIAPEKIRTTASINLIDNTLMPSEAADILREMLATKINFHKLKRLSITEGNHNDPCEYDSGRLQELIAEREHLELLIQKARKEGKKLKIKTEVNIEYID